VQLYLATGINNSMS